MSEALIAPVTASLVPPSPDLLAKLDQAQKIILQCPQGEVVTEHLIHGGMYARTIRRGPGMLSIGSRMLRSTILIIHGNCSFVGGNGERVDLTGYNVIPGCAGRKQLSLTHGPVEMTMLFPTSAVTVEEAENEICAEADQLMSRKDNSKDKIMITGQ